MAKDPTVNERVHKLVSEHFGDPVRVSGDAYFADDLGADSLDFIELAIAVEEEFGIQVDEDEAIKVIRVRDLVDLVHRALAVSRPEAAQ